MSISPTQNPHTFPTIQPSSSSSYQVSRRDHLQTLKMVSFNLSTVLIATSIFTSVICASHIDRAHYLKRSSSQYLRRRQVHPHEHILPQVTVAGQGGISKAALKALTHQDIQGMVRDVLDPNVSARPNIHGNAPPVDEGRSHSQKLERLQTHWQNQADHFTRLSHAARAQNQPTEHLSRAASAARSSALTVEAVHHLHKATKANLGPEQVATHRRNAKGAFKAATGL